MILYIYGPLKSAANVFSMAWELRAMPYVMTRHDHPQSSGIVCPDNLRGSDRVWTVCAWSLAWSGVTNIVSRVSLLMSYEPD